jgi:hypothetical protein
VTPSIPILFFGDTDRYLSSKLKVITVGLNPSRSEFPTEDRFLRFGGARGVYPRILDGAGYDVYLKALNGYFRNHPYGWFGCFEDLLVGLGCSYYGQARNVALHTDLCSPLATDPTWKGLPAEVQSRLIQPGGTLWHSLVDWLSPDLIIASVAREHIDRIRFARSSSWTVVHTIARKNPYNVELAKLRIADGRVTNLVFGKAAQKPFGTVSRIDKRKIGEALKNHF